MPPELELFADQVALPGRRVTKAPPWHGLVTFDLFFSGLASGVFLIAALADLISPANAPVASIGYWIAFPAIMGDLVCLVLDLGDPLRFHHMLRTFKLKSPMSAGVWAIAVFSLISFFTAVAAFV